MLILNYKSAFRSFCSCLCGQSLNSFILNDLPLPHALSLPFLHTKALKPIVKLAVATGCVAQCDTIARLCPSCRSGDRPHRPLSGGPPVLLNRHTIFLKPQCLIESDGLSKNFEPPKKGLQLLYMRAEGVARFK